MQLLNHYVAKPEDEKFYEYSREVDVLKISEGLAGNVWAEGAQILWNDVDKHKDFMRKEAAKKIDRKSVV